VSQQRPPDTKPEGAALVFPQPENPFQNRPEEVSVSAEGSPASPGQVARALLPPERTAAVRSSAVEWRRLTLACASVGVGLSVDSCMGFTMTFLARV
jgi:hypothetical protein